MTLRLHRILRARLHEQAERARRAQRQSEDTKEFSCSAKEQTYIELLSFSLLCPYADDGPRFVQKIPFPVQSGRQESLITRKEQEGCRYELRWKSSPLTEMAAAVGGGGGGGGEE